MLLKPDTAIRTDRELLNFGKTTRGARAIEAGTSGTLYIDDFESRRLSYIGMLPTRA